MNSIFNFFEEYKNEERQLRDFIDLDATFRSINGLQDDFDSLEIQSETIFEDDNKEDSEKTMTMKQNLTQKKAVKIRMMFLICQF